MVVKKTLLESWGWGCYPPGYDRAIHGPYDTTRYYGPADTSLSETKVADLSKWLSRRNKTPLAIAQCVGRNRARWQRRFADAKHAGPAAFWQFIVCTSALFYVMQYNTLRKLIRCSFRSCV